MRASDSAGLTQIEHSIQDLWFDIEAVTLDVARRQLRVPIYHRSPRRVAASNASASFELVVSDVERYSVDDDAAIQWYDIASLSFDAGNSVLAIRSNFPLVVRVHVDHLDVELKES